MKAQSVKDVGKLVALNQRGIASDGELFGFWVEEVERDCLSDYIALLPPDHARQLPAWLDSQPKTSAEWSVFYLPQLDGTAESQRRRVENYRLTVESLRGFFGSTLS